MVTTKYQKKFSHLLFGTANWAVTFSVMGLNEKHLRPVYAHPACGRVFNNYLLKVSVILRAIIMLSGVRTEGLPGLKQVHVVFRHGERAPLSNFDGSGYNPSDWPYGLGQLSANGTLQQYQLGTFFRDRYSKFLTTDKELEEVYVQSTDHDRALQSALATAAGLFLPKENASWGGPQTPLATVWHPVPVHAIPLDNEFVLKPTAKCPKLERLNRELHNLPKLAEMAKQYQETDRILAKYIPQIKAVKGHKTTFWERVTVAADMYTALNTRSLALPYWMRNNQLMGNVTFLADQQFMYWVGAYDDEERSRLTGGALLNVVLERMLNSTKGQAGPKFFLYSGHDSTVAGLLSVLQVYNSSRSAIVNRIPPYNAFVLMELFMNNTVRIAYSNAKELPKNYSEWKDSELAVYERYNCSSFCPLMDFIHMSQRYNVTDWVNECDDRSFLLRALSDHVPASGAWVTIGVLGVLLLIFVGFRWWKDRKQRFNGRPVASQSLSDSVVSYRTLENLNA